jgi:hypothetical protein
MPGVGHGKEWDKPSFFSVTGFGGVGDEKGPVVLMAKVRWAACGEGGAGAGRWTVQRPTSRWCVQGFDRARCMRMITEVCTHVQDGWDMVLVVEPAPALDNVLAWFSKDDKAYLFKNRGLQCYVLGREFSITVQVGCAMVDRVNKVREAVGLPTAGVRWCRQPSEPHRVCSACDAARAACAV